MRRMHPHLASPWYCYPTDDTAGWNHLRDAALAFAVVNVADGPGTSTEESYRNALRAGSRTPFLGYVPIGYGRRLFTDVRADVAAWGSRYGVSRIFLDEVPDVGAQDAWRLDWIDVLRADGVDQVVINPGTTPQDAELVWAADVTCVFEDDWATYVDLPAVEWLRHLPAEKQWHLVHSVPTGAALDIRSRARSLGAAFSWATHGVPPHPWGQGWEGR